MYLMSDEELQNSKGLIYYIRELLNSCCFSITAPICICVPSSSEVKPRPAG